MLDIAAGHGTFGVVLAKQNPSAEIFAVDWPAVLKVAVEVLIFFVVSIYQIANGLLLTLGLLHRRTGTPLSLPAQVQQTSLADLSPASELRLDEFRPLNLKVPLPVS